MDKQAFVALVDEKSQTLFRVARSILRNEEDCNDALQEGILNAWASRHQLKNQRYFGTWMTRIVINECHNILRKQAKYTLMAEVGDGATYDAPDADLHSALDALPEALRLPVVLHYVEGYSYKEIALLLRIPLVTVRNRLFSARKNYGLIWSQRRRSPMKRDALKNFAPMPKRSYDLMMAAARSVEEETVVKRKVSAAVVLAMVLILAAGVALALALSLQDTGRKVLETEQTQGAYQDWPTEEKISLVQALAELGYVEKSPPVLNLVGGELPENEARRVADEALIAFTGKDLPEISFTEIMEAVWGPFGSWSAPEKAWFSQLMADTGLQGEDHTFYQLPEGPVGEAQAIAIARREIANGYGIEESVLDRYELSASFQVPEFLTAKGEKQPYWHVEYVTPLAFQEPLPFTGISVFVHPDTGALLQSVESILAERRAVQSYQNDPLLQIPRAFYEEHGRFETMSHEARTRFSREIVPVILQLAEKYPEYYHAFTLAGTVFTYGVPDEKALPEKEAQALVERELVATFGHKEEEIPFFAHDMRIYYDITDPRRPLWKFFILRPSQYDMDKRYTDAVIAYYGKNDGNYPPCNYKFEIDAFTGEIILAIPVDPVLDLFSMEEQLLMY